MVVIEFALSKYIILTAVIFMWLLWIFGSLRRGDMRE